MTIHRKVFISHSSKDDRFAIRLAEDLQKSGIRVWLDVWDLKVGDSLHTVIGNAIERSAAVVIILSPTSVGSRWCMDELSVALAQEKEQAKIILLPVLYKKCQIPPFLKDRVYANFQISYHSGYSALFNALKERVPRPESGSNSNILRHAVGMWSVRSPDISTKENGFPDPIRFLEMITKQNSFQGVSFLFPSDLGKVTPSSFAASLEEAPLVCSSIVIDLFDFMDYGGFSSFDEKVRLSCVTRAKEAIDFANQLRCRTVIIWTAFECSLSMIEIMFLQERWNLFKTSLVALSDYIAVKNYNIRIAIETQHTSGSPSSIISSRNWLRNEIVVKNIQSIIGLSMDIDEDIFTKVPRAGNPFGWEMVLDHFLKIPPPFHLHTRVTHQTAEIQRSIIAPLAWLIHDLQKAHFKGWVTHSVLPFDRITERQNCLAALEENVLLWIEIEGALGEVNWKKLTEEYEKSGKLISNRLLLSMLRMD